jgi:hypothetical protein
MESRRQALPWDELVDLKVGCEYVLRYRDGLAATMTRFAVIRAVVSVSALGTWAAIKSYPMVWGGIIAAAQVADALQTAIPLANMASVTASKRDPNRAVEVGRWLSQSHDNKMRN